MNPPSLPGHHWKASLLALTLVAGSEALTVAAPPTPIRITKADLASDQLTLSWTGAAEYYQVQSATRLGLPNWRPALLTTNTQATLSFINSPVFFRVVTGVPLHLDTSPVTDQRRIEILRAIDGKIASLPGANQNADLTELLSFISGIAEIQDAGIADDTSIWAQFQDGRPLVVINNRSRTGAAGVQPRGLDPATAPVARSSIMIPLDEIPGVPEGVVRPAVIGRIGLLSTPTGIPVSNRIFLFQASLPGIIAKTAQALASAFQDRQYQVTVDEASLANLMSLTNYSGDIGALYVNTHGTTGILQRVLIDPQAGVTKYFDEPFFALETSTVVDPTNQAALKGFLNRAEIGYSLPGPALRDQENPATDPAASTAGHYFILPRFVANYLKFGPNSIVHFDACHSGGPAALSFIAACCAKGAAVYSGWSVPVDDSEAAYTTLKLIDPLLGGSKLVDTTKPPQRAFDVRSVLAYLIQSKDDTGPATGAKLLLYRSLAAPTDFGSFAPSIRSMQTDEVAGQLHIFGLFDPTTPATVRIEGKSTMEIPATAKFMAGLELQTDPTEIVCPLPASEEPFAGNVTVIQRGHPSNTVPLSEWRISGDLVRFFEVMGEDRGPSATYQFNIRLRADVHSFRRSPYGTSSFQGASTTAAVGSTASLVSTTGTYQDPNGLRTVEWELASPKMLPLSYERFDVNSTAFTGNLRVQPDGSIYFTVVGSAKDGITNVERYKNPDGTIQVTRSPFNPLTRTFSPMGKNGTMDLSSYIIATGKGSNAGDGGRTSWGTSNPEYPPKTNIPGYAE